MLKQGLFILPDGSAFNTYEVTETGFYRFDIVKEGADFMTDIEAVIYSIVRRRKTYVYGKRNLYDEYVRIKHESGSITTKNTESSSFWEFGKFMQKYTAVDESIGYVCETVKENGAFSHSLVRYKGYTIVQDVLSRVYNVKIDPINFYDYEEIVLGEAKQDVQENPYYSLEYLKSHFPIDHLFKENYILVKDVNKARRLLQIFKNSPNPLRGVDTETTGLDITMYGKDKLVGVILAWSEHDSVYFPFRHTKFDNLPIDFLEEVVEVINYTYEKNIAQNKPFDINVFRKEGYNVKIKWDTLQLAIILDMTVKKQESHSLKDLSYKITGKRYLELTDIFISAKMIDFSVLPEEIVRIYACPDSATVITVFKSLLKQLPSIQHELFEYECAVADLASEQEYYGMRVDVKQYEKQYKNCNYILDMLLKAFKTITRFTGNINSPDALRDLVYYKMKCPVLSRTKTGRPSTNASVIVKLANKQAKVPGEITNDLVDLDGNIVLSASKLANSRYPALLILNKYREYSKLKTAFYARFERTMSTGRVFFWINTNGAASGRHSSPMHQLPPALKEVMLSDTPEHKFWGPDYSQIELRIIAYLAGEKDLIEMCKDPNNDIHRVIGSLISGKEMWEITDKERSEGKRRNFGVVYDITGYGLAGQIIGPGYTKEDVKYCTNLIAEFMERFKWIRRYVQNNKRRVHEIGFMETDILHRRRGFYEIFDPNISNKAKASFEKQANNMPVQGTGADILKIALVNMHGYIREKGWDKILSSGFPKVRIMLSIHDEILISAHESILPVEIIKMIRDCMEIEVKGAPPFFVEPAHMQSWGGHTDSSASIPVDLRNELIKEFDETGTCRLTYNNYSSVVKDFHSHRLKDYMDNLIRKYGSDYSVVGEHVRHPYLTFDLLASFKSLKNFEGTQAEKIIEATKLYMEEKMTGDIESVVAVEKDSDVSEFFNELESLTHYDKDGNIVFEDAEEEEAEEIYDEDYEEYLTSGEIYKVWDIGDTIMLDLNNVSTDSANEIIAEVFKYKDDTGFYKVLLYYDNQVLDPKFNVESVDVKALSDLILSKE